MRFSCLSVLLSLGATLVAPAHAQQTPDLPGAPDTTQAAESDLDEVTITANRRVTPRSKTPATVSIKTRSELDREQPLLRTVADALQTLPGITINRLGLLSGAANIRGLTGERIAVLVDGERLPNLEFGPDLGSVDPFRVERLEVLKGPASSIYGADAFGGVINIITTLPRFDTPPKVRTYLYGGNFSEIGGNVEFQGPNVVAGLSLRTAGDAKDGLSRPIPTNGTGYDAFDAYASGRIDFDATNHLELRFDRYRQSYADLNGFPNPPFVFAQNQFRNRDRYSIAYINDGAPGGTSFALRANYQKNERRFDNTTAVTIPVFAGPFAVGGNGTSSLFGTPSRQAVFAPPAPPTFITLTTPSSTYSLTETYGLSAQANTALGSAVLTYGYDFSQDASTSIDRFAVPSVQSPLATRSFNGVFLQGSYDITPSFTVAGGVRYDTYDQNTNTGLVNNANRVTFNAGAIYSVTPELALRANFAQGFRPPSLLFLFGSNPEGTFFAPSAGNVQANPNLRPERADNFDIGVNYTSREFRAGITYFNNQVTDFLGFGPLVAFGAPPFGPPPPSQTVLNKNVQLQGLEFSSAYFFSPQAFFEANLTYVDGRDGSGLPLSQLEVFPLTALLRLVYDDRTFNALLQSRIYGGQGSVIGNNGVVGPGTPPAGVLDLSFGYRFVPNVQLTVSVENVTNAQYLYPTSGFVAPGARLLGAVRAEF
ncbi:TonB-dependent receptor plug domain-containing protein [Gloeobacter morelensis]|uniref:TonB-dependent receptor n=1 Tax=Gloeobacter morelensis MG652769 TaxID=2781736 RepID=A0ABY3PHL8_9CYAN|nr:TonB-dependent receptor [Gloeobacter morelensis]UFP93166.1 TonB-dependent receptor [Gloeobacter morelensis MG652769]